MPSIFLCLGEPESFIAWWDKSGITDILRIAEKCKMIETLFSCLFVEKV